jgi:hypothetical protein
MMTKRFNFIRFPMLMILFGFLSACSPTSPPILPTGPQQIATTESVLPTLEPILDSTVTQPVQTTLQPSPAFTPGLECKLLQDLNLRKGPGVAYTPPALVLPENSVVVPLGYIPKGIPRGSWVMVLDPSTQQIGWVNAANIYVSCNSDITALPQVAVEPPPPPTPPSVESSVPEGSCGEGGIAGKDGNIYDCAVEFLDGLPLQFIVLKDGQEAGSADGVINVVFRVKRGDQLIYSRTESNKDYCLFSGDGPCNPWVIEDYAIKWEPGGALVESGEYEISMDATLDDEPDVVLHWDAVVTINLQP